MTFYFSATYFNAIMFMVAASVVTTILVLNYHHRLADTHEMPDWVFQRFLTQLLLHVFLCSGSEDFPAMDSLDAENVSPRREDNEKEHPHAEEN